MSATPSQTPPRHPRRGPYLYGADRAGASGSAAFAGGGCGGVRCGAV